MRLWRRSGKYKIEGRMAAWKHAKISLVDNNYTHLALKDDEKRYFWLLVGTCRRFPR